MQIFDSYVSESSFDEVYDDDKNVRKCWKDILKDIEKAGLDLVTEKQDEIDWHLQDNGVTYNMYDNYDTETHRSWSMDPIPFVIDEKEWDEVQKGLKQRAKLFNLILKDIYSEQKLIKENIVPAEVIFGHRGFSAEVFDFGNKEDFNLYFYATDIARGPDGKMWVISDKTQAPSGLGYAIENRLTMNVIRNDLYPHIESKKLSPFLYAFKDLLEDLTDGDLSKAALLTPGPYNETYFEHAYLSAYLNISLVQGQDLLSKNGSLWIKSLSGLKKIHTLLRRVDDRFSDPLELKNDSRLGVAGLVESMRQNNLNMINPIGSAVLENIGLNPFMGKIAQYFLKEDLILPQIATWWCGQKKELDFVLKHIDTLVIKKIDRTRDIKVYFGKSMTPKERDELRIVLQQDPYKYVAQEYVDFSTVPYYHDGIIEPRNAVIRAFSLRNKDEYTVMDGGLVRMASGKDNLLVSSKSGGISKDLWVLGKDSVVLSPFNTCNQTSYVETSIDKISTLRAENLFWLGRYLSRSISTTRLISYVIKNITNSYRFEVATSKESQMILQNALTHMTMTYPGFIDPDKEKNLKVFPMVEITSVIKDIHRSGSLALTLSMLANANLNVKDLLTLESWKLFERLQKEWNQFVKRKGDSTLVVSRELDTLLIYLMAYKELVKESIFKEQGLILYDIGYKIEEALLLISKAKSMLCLKLDKSAGHDVLEGMLNSMESFNAYRAHYKTSLTLENVVDFLIFNPQFPKSLIYIIDTLLSKFKLLPKAKKILTSYETILMDAKSLLDSADINYLLSIKEEDGVYVELDEMLSSLSDLFLECSNAFSNTYFAHYDE